MFRSNLPPRQDDSVDDDPFVESVSPEAIEIGEDRILFPGMVLLPLTVRAEGIPGLPQRPWNRLAGSDFLGEVPTMYSLALTREPPDRMRSSLRVRRTLFEGVLLALAEKTGRRPSSAENAADAALDEAESRLAMGDPAFRCTLLTGLFATREREDEADSARLALEIRLKARGFRTQRFSYVAERALSHFQPGGILFPGIHEPVLMLEEALRIIPRPSQRVFPPKGSVWLGTAQRDGRDVFFSPKHGFSVDSPESPHATSLLLGEMGSGKTSLMRSILIQRLMQGRSVISIDPEGENNRLCESMGGRVIPAGQPADPGLCLFHPLEAESPGEMLFAARFLISALNPGGRHSVIAQAVLHDLIQGFWEDKPGRKISISELVDALKSNPGRGVERLAALLHPFAAGGLWDGFFDRPKAILDRSIFEIKPGEASSMWWNFDLSGLREENKAIVHALLTWFLYQVISVTQTPLDVFLDEGWRLLRNPEFAGLLDELGRRARKRGIGIMLATHLPEDLSERPNSLSLASNAFVGRLSPGQALNFLTSLGIPEQKALSHAETISKLPPHIFYAVPGGGRGSLFPFRVRLPEAWLNRWKESGAGR